MLVTMYSINVFVTFSLSQLGMTPLFLAAAQAQGQVLTPLFVHALSFILCFSSWSRSSS